MAQAPRTWKHAPVTQPVVVAARPTTIPPVKDPRAVEEGTASLERKPPPPLPTDDDPNPL